MQLTGNTGHPINMVGDGRERRRIHTDKTRDRIFFEAHRKEITIHKVAKKTFNELDVKRIPRVKDLNADYVRFTAEKNRPSLNIGRSGMM